MSAAEPTQVVVDITEIGERDLIVIECAAAISNEGRKRLTDYWLHCIKTQRPVILDHGLTIRVLRNGRPAP